MIKKLIAAIIFYSHPTRLKLIIRTAISSTFYSKKKYIRLAPNYLLKRSFSENEVAIDVGCGFDAELSQYLINSFNMKCFCVDPTKKHEGSLKKIENNYNGQLNYLQLALYKENTELTFNETVENESGSFYNDHKNILKDKLIQYQVKAVDIANLITITGANEIALLKIDIEGAEYDIFEKVDKVALQKCKQIFIEFHHISIKRFRKTDTRKVVRKIKNLGYQSHTLDGLNYLFIRK